jgi:hypothetical protein
MQQGSRRQDADDAYCSARRCAWDTIAFALDEAALSDPGDPFVANVITPRRFAGDRRVDACVESWAARASARRRKQPRAGWRSRGCCCPQAGARSARLRGAEASASSWKRQRGIRRTELLVVLTSSTDHVDCCILRRREQRVGLTGRGWVVPGSGARIGWTDLLGLWWGVAGPGFTGCLPQLTDGWALTGMVGGESELGGVR